MKKKKKKNEDTKIKRVASYLFTSRSTIYHCYELMPYSSSSYQKKMQGIVYDILTF